MSEESTSNTKLFSPHASLAVIGLKLQELKLFEIGWERPNRLG